MYFLRQIFNDANAQKMQHISEIEIGYAKCISNHNSAECFVVFLDNV